MTKPKLLALRDLGTTFLAAIVGGVAINIVASEFTAQQIALGLVMIALTYIVYVLYTIRVSHYEYQEKLNKQVDNLSK